MLLGKVMISNENRDRRERRRHFSNIKYNIIHESSLLRIYSPVYRYLTDISVRLFGFVLIQVSNCKLVFFKGSKYIQIARLNFANHGETVMDLVYSLFNQHFRLSVI